MLSSKKSKRRSSYIDFVMQGETAEIERFYSLKNLPSMLGNDSFKEWVKEKFQHLSLQGEIPESRSLTPAAEEIVSIVCDYFKIKNEDIYRSKRGRENLPRDVAIYLVRRYCRETLADVGQHFEINNYSTVSSSVERIKSRKAYDKELQKRLVKIEEKLNKSQRQT